MLSESVPQENADTIFIFSLALDCLTHDAYIEDVVGYYTPRSFSIVGHEWVPEAAALSRANSGSGTPAEKGAVLHRNGSIYIHQCTADQSQWLGRGGRLPTMNGTITPIMHSAGATRFLVCQMPKRISSQLLQSVSRCGWFFLLFVLQYINTETIIDI